MQTLVCLLLLVVCSFGVGRLCLWRVRFARPAETFVFASATGLAAPSYAMLLLGAVGRMTPLVVLLVFVAACVPSFVLFARFAGRIRWCSLRWTPLSAICLALLAAGAVLNALVTLNPILEVDAWEYHIPIPKAWLVAGRLFPVPYCLQANFHFLTEMLNVVALSLSKNDVTLCKLVQWYSAILMAAATGCFARSFFSARVAWVAAVLFYLVKEISWISATAYIDLTQGLYVWLGVFALVRAVRLSSLAWHALAGLMFGFGFASKHSGALFFAMAYLACGAALLLDPLHRSRLPHWFRGTLLAGAIATIAAVPWMAKNHVHTGDPFFPFLAGRFNVPPEFASQAPLFPACHGDLSSYLIWDGRTLSRVTAQFDNFRTNVMYSGANTLIVWFLISGLVLVAIQRRKPLSLQLLVAIGVIAAPWFALVTSRYLFGFFPVYVLILVQTLRMATGRRRRLFAVLAVLLLLPYVRTFVRYSVYGRPGGKALTATHGPMFTATAREEWLLANDRLYPLIQRVNEVLGRSDRLLACGSLHAMPWIDAPFLPNPHSLSQPLPLLLWERFGDPAAMRRWLDEQRITHILLSESAARELEQESGFVSAHLRRLFGEAGLALYRLEPRRQPPGSR
jgi:hypothetical protein